MGAASGNRASGHPGTFPNLIYLSLFKGHGDGKYIQNPSGDRAKSVVKSPEHLSVRGYRTIYRKSTTTRVQKGETTKIITSKYSTLGLEYLAIARD